MKSSVHRESGYSFLRSEMIFFISAFILIGLFLIRFKLPFMIAVRGAFRNCLCSRHADIRMDFPAGGVIGLAIDRYEIAQAVLFEYLVKHTPPVFNLDHVFIMFLNRIFDIIGVMNYIIAKGRPALIFRDIFIGCHKSIIGVFFKRQPRQLFCLLATK